MFDKLQFICVIVGFVL